MFRQIAISTAAIAALIFGLSSVGESQLSAAANELPNALIPSTSSRAQQQMPSSPVKSSLDRTGYRRFGKASFYAERYVGRKMADGSRMQRNGNNAASLTLPLGTVARVTNLETGRSEVVTIRDRGPYVSGRIIDLSPGTAARLGIERRQGLAQVAVAPISIPPAKAGMEKHDMRLSAVPRTGNHAFFE